MRTDSHPTDSSPLATHGQSIDFICEALTTEEAREGGRGRDDPVRLDQTGREFRHGDVRLGLDRSHKERLIRGQSAFALRPALRIGGRRTGALLTLQQFDRKAVAM